MKSEIKVRGLDPTTIKALDRLATQHEMSRNALCVLLLTNATTSAGAEIAAEKYKLWTDKLAAVVAENTKVLQQILDDEE